MNFVTRTQELISRVRHATPAEIVAHLNGWIDEIIALGKAEGVPDAEIASAVGDLECANAEREQNDVTLTEAVEKAQRRMAGQWPEKP